MPLEWSDPPSGKWSTEAEELRANPGRWALIKLSTDRKSGPHRMAFLIKSGGLSAFTPKGAFEALVQGGQIYARFVGANSNGGGES